MAALNNVENFEEYGHAYGGGVVGPEDNRTVRYSKVFGYVNLFPLNSVGRVTGVRFDSTTSVDSFVGRELGLAKSIKHNSRLIDAVTQPSEYLRQANASLSAIISSAGQAYREEYRRQLVAGATESDSEKQAMDLAKLVKDRLMKQYEKEYPTDVQNKAIKESRLRLGGR